MADLPSPGDDEPAVIVGWSPLTSPEEATTTTLQLDGGGLSYGAPLAPGSRLVAFEP